MYGDNLFLYSYHTQSVIKRSENTATIGVGNMWIAGIEEGKISDEGLSAQSTRRYHEILNPV